MGLSVDIKSKLPDFDLDVSFELENETLGLLGASGCGKSLTMRSIAGLEKPDEGRIVLNGRVLFDSKEGINLTPQQRKTAMLFQNYQLFPHMRVASNIAAGIPLSVDGETRDAMVAEQIKHFDLMGLERRYPAKLSGGQQQRVALARMLAAHPEILMLDEPFSALDEHLKGRLQQSLLKLSRSFEGPVVFVSHDIDEAYLMCDKVAVIEDGHVSEIGATENIVKRPGSLAAIKLSGCKNISRAEYIDDHKVYCKDWGVAFQTYDVVPFDVQYIGVRATYIIPATDQTHNVVRCRYEQVSESRFTSISLVRPLTEGADRDGQPIVVKASKKDGVALPIEGQEVDLYFQPYKLYLVNH